MQIVETKDKYYHKKLGAVLPSTECFANAEIVVLEPEMWDKDCVSIHVYGSSVSIHGREDIATLIEFLTRTVEAIDERDAQGCEPAPEGAKVGISVDEIEALSK